MLDIVPGFCQPVDDTKMSNAADELEEKDSIQRDLGSLHDLQQGQVSGPAPG